MADLYTDHPIIPVLLIRASHHAHTYDAATGIFSTTLKIDWVTQNVIRTWFGMIMLTISYVVYGRVAFLKLFNRFSNKCLTHTL